jgi:hypothetical protein
MQTNAIRIKGVPISQESKDCNEIALRTGFSLDYVKKVLMYSIRHNETIWTEYAKLQKERQEAIDRTLSAKADHGIITE